MGKINVDAKIVEELFNKGLGAKSIAKIIGVSRDVVQRVFKENNLHRAQIVNTLEDFWSRIDKSNGSGCWLWTGNVNNHGYGQFRLFKKPHFAHRLSYQLTKGEIPKGLDLCHKCDNPRCCNPDHLIPGTPLYNIVDCLIKKRRPSVKLDVDKVREIRRLYKSGVARKDLRELYGIGKTTLDEVVTYKRWRFVE